MKTIYLLGYMGSGKSTVGSVLAKALSCEFLDYDSYIESREGMSISQIFNDRGEIYFRKIEHTYLRELLTSNGSSAKVVALGGGTPCYGTNLELLKKAEVQTIYLNVSYKVLAQRLWNAKGSRPLIASMQHYDQLEDYVRKHLFERSYYYNKADTVIKVCDERPEVTVEHIIATLF